MLVPSTCDARHDGATSECKAWVPSYFGNSSLDLHRAVPVILNRLDLDLAPAHIRDGLRLDWSSGYPLCRLDSTGAWEKARKAETI